MRPPPSRNEPMFSSLAPIPPRAAAGSPSKKGRGPDYAFAEPLRQAIHHPGELLAPKGRGIEERQLAAAREGETRGGQADEPHGLVQGLAVQERPRAPVQLEAVLRRLRGHGACDRA